MDVDVRRARCDRGKTLKLRDLNAGVHRARDDLARVLPGVAARRAHRRTRTATPGCSKLVRGLRPGLDTQTRRSRTRSSVDLDRLQASFDEASSAVRRDARARWRRPRRRAARDRRSTTLQGARGDGERRGSYPVQLGARPRAARGAASSTRRSQAFERAAALVPLGDGRRQPARADGGVASERERHRRARSSELDGARAQSTSTTSRRRASWRRCCASRRRRSGAAAARRRAHRRASIRSTPTAHARSAASRWRRNDADGRGARVPRCSRCRPVDRRAAHTDLAESYLRAAAAAPRRRSRRSPRSRSRRASSARRSCCSSIGGRTMTGATGGASCRLAPPRRCAVAGAGRPSPARSRRAAASRHRPLTRSALRRPAVALRAHQYHSRGPMPPRPGRTSTASRGTSTRRRPSRTSRAACETATAIQVNDPIVITLEDPSCSRYPWIYIVEPGNLRLNGSRGADPARVPAARRHADVRRLPRPDRVGQRRARDEARVSRSRDRRAAEGPSGLQLLLQARRLPADRRASARSCRAAPGRRAASSPHLRAIYDDTGRPMVLINWNTDMGDGWEWSNAAEYPGYVKYTALAYRMGSTKSSTRSHIDDMTPDIGSRRTAPAVRRARRAKAASGSSPSSARSSSARTRSSSRC